MTQLLLLILSQGTSAFGNDGVTHFRDLPTFDDCLLVSIFLLQVAPRFIAGFVAWCDFDTEWRRQLLDGRGNHVMLNFSSFSFLYT
jgi:hypothetical protein